MFEEASVLITTCYIIGTIGGFGVSFYFRKYTSKILHTLAALAVILFILLVSFLFAGDLISPSVKGMVPSLFSELSIWIQPRIIPAAIILLSFLLTSYIGNRAFDKTKESGATITSLFDVNSQRKESSH